MIMYSSRYVHFWGLSSHNSTGRPRYPMLKLVEFHENPLSRSHIYGKKKATRLKNQGLYTILLKGTFFTVFHRILNFFLHGSFPVKLFHFSFFEPPKKFLLTTRVGFLVVLKNSYFSVIFENDSSSKLQSSDFLEKQVVFLQ